MNAVGRLSPSRGKWLGAAALTAAAVALATALLWGRGAEAPSSLPSKPALAARPARPSFDSLTVLLALNDVVESEPRLYDASQKEELLRGLRAHLHILIRGMGAKARIAELLTAAEWAAVRKRSETLDRQDIPTDAPRRLLALAEEQSGTRFDAGEPVDFPFRAHEVVRACLELESPPTPFLADEQWRRLLPLVVACDAALRSVGGKGSTDETQLLATIMRVGAFSPEMDRDFVQEMQRLMTKRQWEQVRGEIERRRGNGTLVFTDHGYETFRRAMGVGSLRLRAHPSGDGRRLRLVYDVPVPMELDLAAVYLEVEAWRLKLDRERWRALVGPLGRCVQSLHERDESLRAVQLSLSPPALRRLVEILPTVPRASATDEFGALANLLNHLSAQP